MSLHDYFEQVDAVEDVDEATAKVIAAIGDAEWRALMYPAVRASLTFFRRGEVYKIERGGPTTRATAEPIAGSSEARSLNLLRRELLDRGFALGDGRRVLWGEATVADHELRIEFLTKKMCGIKRTVGRHDTAIAEIKATRGAKCLNDVARKNRRAA